MKTTYHVQCYLQKDNRHTVAWIEERFAVQEKIVAMERADGSFEEGWKVVHAGSKRESKSVQNFAHGAGEALWRATSGSIPRGNK